MRTNASAIHTVCWYNCVIVVSSFAVFHFLFSWKWFLLFVSPEIDDFAWIYHIWTSVWSVHFYFTQGCDDHNWRSLLTIFFISRHCFYTVFPIHFSALVCAAFLCFLTSFVSVFFFCWTLEIVRQSHMVPGAFSISVAVE